MMSEQYIGEIRMVGFNYAPEGWALCDGSLLEIQQYTTLYSLLGNAFGGTPGLTFALPDLRGRFPIGVGTAPGRSQYIRGQAGGFESVKLSSDEMPKHTHTLKATSGASSTADPSQAILADTGRSLSYASETPSISPTLVDMGEDAIGATGGSAPHDNMPPYLPIYFIIALEGIYPPHN
jgi:microcystin-dependent protein